MTNIRLIEEKDNAIMKNIIQSILRDHGLAIAGTAYFDESLNNLSQHYRVNKPSNYYIVEVEGSIVGGGGYGPYDLEKKITELQKIYIDPAYQGQGFSSKLFSRILEDARKDGYEKIYIETTDKLEKANLVYLKWGFQALESPLKAGEHYAMNRFFIKDL